MDMKQLKCFVAAAQAGNFTRASEQLNTAQSALSRHIANLEAELGVQLFVRMGRGVELSPEGAIAYDRAVKLLGDFRGFSRDVTLAKDKAATRWVTMAAHGGMGPRLLPRVARLIRQTDENVHFRVGEALSEHIERDVSLDECQVGIVMRRIGFQVERTDLETIKLIDDEVIAIQPCDKGGTIGEPWTADEAMRHPVVMPPTGSIERASFENWARRYDRQLHVVGEAVSVAMRLELARQIGATCLLPSIVMADLIERSRWRVHPLVYDEHYRGNEWFVIYRRTEGDPLIRAVAEMVQRQVLAMGHAGVRPAAGD